jgi:spermidine synthase
LIPWQHLDTAKVPGGGEMRLIRRGSEYSIMLGNIALMNSRLFGSEEALAALSFGKIAERGDPRVLIGGLGMGFTLRAALAIAPAGGRIDVSELVPEVVAWARGPMAEIFAGSLEDPRTRVIVEDVGAIMRRARGTYDAILLDVDNGPEGLSRPGNDSLYSAAGLALARGALKRGGVLGVWSQGPDERFTQRLRKAGFEVDEQRVRASKSKRGARHVIWLAVRS